MKHILPFFLVLFVLSCKKGRDTSTESSLEPIDEMPVVIHDDSLAISPITVEEHLILKNVNVVEVEGIFRYADVSIRTLEILKDKTLAFAANNGIFGMNDLKTGMWQTSIIERDTLTLNFRATAHTSSDFFMLSIENPALLYKTGDKGRMVLVYEEQGEGVFYDAMTFWDDKEGMAIGDSVNGCISVIITRDGGTTWKKLDCSQLPETEAGEGAFAASNTNIKTLGDKAWFGTTHGNIYYTEDRGQTWQVTKTVIASEGETQGIYSIDFYDELHGFAIGGDYKHPELNAANKIRTSDGGKTWELVAQNQKPGYSSCVQYVPRSGGKALVASSFQGIYYSIDSGNSWKEVTEAGFYALRFLNDSVAYGTGPGKIAKLTFKDSINSTY
ncbi:oxidoreductase [Pseudotamlana carrageenivorans]|uniref:Oxidoreductase n=1 Tax=Pseudotamlana carrageenivorans TaxID=2069432 RepID=A0A2I7SE83_9FLAO|nr:oxidoreductase [Tamlana carrageenivorans]AUS04203.1 oxidoreductase [Tamlana carrageenivorans]